MYFFSFGLEKADYFLLTGDVCLWKIYEVIVMLSEVISDFVPKCEMYLLVMGPHQDNKYIQGAMLPGGIMLLVSITCNSSHHLCLHCVGYRTNLEVHSLSNSGVLLD